jgi:NodT family efflux transporter outer membrane factor (OMF) lipoprotein
MSKTIKKNPTESPLPLGERARVRGRCAEGASRKLDARLRGHDEGRLGRKTLIATIGTLSVILAACSVGPDYKRPDAPVPQQYKELAGWTQSAPADSAPKGEWWKAFNDPLLDDLEPQVAVSNQSVKQSYYNYQQALALVEEARAGYFPTIGVTGSATRSGGGNSTTSGVSHGSNVVNSGSVEGTASWTLDIWGKVRRQVEESKAVAQSDEATLANATLSEQTLLATTVMELRIADADIDLEQRTVDEYKEALRIVEAQGKAGITATPPSAVITARVALETAQADLTGLGVARAQYAHAIAVLAGRNPEDMDIPHSSNLPALPQIPVGVPSTLLQRRPDIASAERTMAAQNAAVGVAVAAYYPTISLSAADGFSQTPLDALFRAANHVWSIGASANETIFDFGAREGTVNAAKAAYEASVANYRQTVLSAFQNVENDLSGLRILAQQADQLDVAVKDATDGARIALAEFQAGTVDYTTVAQAQETLFNDQQSRLSVQQSRLTDAVALIGDLGGDWAAAQLHDPGHPDRPPPAQQASAGH